MKILQNCKGMGWLACSLVSAGLFISSTALALSTQGNLSTATRRTEDPASPVKTATTGLTKNPMLARNTTAKIEPGPKATTATASVPKSEDKKTISRCWQRLMNMAREVNHAHRKSRK